MTNPPFGRGERQSESFTLETSQRGFYPDFQHFFNKILDKAYKNDVILGETGQ